MIIDATALRLLVVDDYDLLCAACYLDCFPLDCDCPNSCPR